MENNRLTIQIGGGVSDGAFERFLTSAVATILTIIFSWKLLLETERVYQIEDLPPPRHKRRPLSERDQDNHTQRDLHQLNPWKDDSKEMEEDGDEYRGENGMQIATESTGDVVVMESEGSLVAGCATGECSGDAAAAAGSGDDGDSGVVFTEDGDESLTRQQQQQQQQQQQSHQQQQQQHHTAHVLLPDVAAAVVTDDRDADADDVGIDGDDNDADVAQGSIRDGRSQLETGPELDVRTGRSSDKPGNTCHPAGRSALTSPDTSLSLHSQHSEDYQDALSHPLPRSPHPFRSQSTEDYEDALSHPPSDNSNQQSDNEEINNNTVSTDPREEGLISPEERLRLVRQVYKYIQQVTLTDTEEEEEEREEGEEDWGEEEGEDEGTDGSRCESDSCDSGDSTDIESDVAYDEERDDIINRVHDYITHSADQHTSPPEEEEEEEGNSDEVGEQQGEEFASDEEEERFAIITDVYNYIIASGDGDDGYDGDEERNSIVSDVCSYVTAPSPDNLSYLTAPSPVESDFTTDDHNNSFHTATEGHNTTLESIDSITDEENILQLTEDISFTIPPADQTPDNEELNYTYDEYFAAIKSDRGGYMTDSSESTLGGQNLDSDTEKESDLSEVSSGDGPSEPSELSSGGEAREYDVGEPMGDSSSDSEYCVVFNHVLGTIAEESDDALSPRSLASDEDDVTKSDDVRMSETGSISNSDMDADVPITRSNPALVNTQRPLIIGSYTDRQSKFATDEDRYIIAGRPLRPTQDIYSYDDVTGAAEDDVMVGGGCPRDGGYFDSNLEESDLDSLIIGSGDTLSLDGTITSMDDSENNYQLADVNNEYDVTNDDTVTNYGVTNDITKEDDLDRTLIENVSTEYVRPSDEEDPVNRDKGSQDQELLERAFNQSLLLNSESAPENQQPDFGSFRECDHLGRFSQSYDNSGNIQQDDGIPDCDEAPMNQDEGNHDLRLMEDVYEECINPKTRQLHENESLNQESDSDRSFGDAPMNQDRGYHDLQLIQAVHDECVRTSTPTDDAEQVNVMDDTLEDERYEDALSGDGDVSEVNPRSAWERREERAPCYVNLPQNPTDHRNQSNRGQDGIRDAKSTSRSPVESSTEPITVREDWTEKEVPIVGPTSGGIHPEEKPPAASTVHSTYAKLDLSAPDNPTEYVFSSGVRQYKSELFIPAPSSTSSPGENEPSTHAEHAIQNLSRPKYDVTSGVNEDGKEDWRVLVTTTTTYVDAPLSSGQEQTPTGFTFSRIGDIYKDYHERVRPFVKPDYQVNQNQINANMGQSASSKNKPKLYSHQNGEVIGQDNREVKEGEYVDTGWNDVEEDVDSTSASSMSPSGGTGDRNRVEYYVGEYVDGGQRATYKYIVETDPDGRTHLRPATEVPSHMATSREITKNSTQLPETRGQDVSYESDQSDGTWASSRRRELADDRNKPRDAHHIPASRLHGNTSEFSLSRAPSRSRTTLYSNDPDASIEDLHSITTQSHSGDMDGDVTPMRDVTAIHDDVRKPGDARGDGGRENYRIWQLGTSDASGAVGHVMRAGGGEGKVAVPTVPSSDPLMKHRCTALATSTALARKDAVIALEGRAYNKDKSPIVESLAPIISSVASAEATGDNPYIAVARATARAATVATANATAGAAALPESPTVQPNDISVVVSTSCRIKNEKSSETIQESREVIEALGKEPNYTVHTKAELEHVGERKAIESPVHKKKDGQAGVIADAQRRMKITIEQGGRGPEGGDIYPRTIECDLPADPQSSDLTSIVNDAVRRIIASQQPHHGGGGGGIHLDTKTIDSVTRQVLRAYEDQQRAEAKLEDEKVNKTEESSVAGEEWSVRAHERFPLERREVPASSGNRRAGGGREGDRQAPGAREEVSPAVLARLPPVPPPRTRSSYHATSAAIRKATQQHNQTSVFVVTGKHPGASEPCYEDEVVVKVVKNECIPHADTVSLSGTDSEAGTPNLSQRRRRAQERSAASRHTARRYKSPAATEGGPSQPQQQASSPDDDSSSLIANKSARRMDRSRYPRRGEGGGSGTAGQRPVSVRDDAAAARMAGVRYSQPDDNDARHHYFDGKYANSEEYETQRESLNHANTDQNVDDFSSYYRRHFSTPASSRGRAGVSVVTVDVSGRNIDPAAPPPSSSSSSSRRPVSDGISHSSSPVRRQSQEVRYTAPLPAPRERTVSDSSDGGGERKPLKSILKGGSNESLPSPTRHTTSHASFVPSQYSSRNVVVTSSTSPTHSYSSASTSPSHSSSSTSSSAASVLHVSLLSSSPPPRRNLPLTMHQEGQYTNGHDVTASPRAVNGDSPRDYVDGASTYTRRASNTQSPIRDKNYKSVLLDPVQDKATPFHVRQHLGSPAESTDLSPKHESMRKEFMDKIKEGSKKPSYPRTIYDEEFEARKKRWANKKVMSPPKNVMVVDIDIEGQLAKQKSRTQSYEDLKKKLSSIRLRAPVSSFADKNWPKVPMQAYRSERALNELHGTSMTSSTSRKSSVSSMDSSTLDDGYIRKARSMGTLPGQFFSDRSSYTSLIETDIDTMETVQQPLIKETNIDDVLPTRTRSVTNLPTWSAVDNQMEDTQRHRSMEMIGREIRGDNLDYGSEHELRISQATNKLSLPDWYRASIRKSRETLVLRSNSNASAAAEKSLSFRSHDEVTSPTDGQPTSTSRPVIIRHRVSTFTRTSPSPSPVRQLVDDKFTFELPSEKLRQREAEIKTLRQIETKPMGPVPVPPERGESKMSAKERYLMIKAQLEGRTPATDNGDVPYVETTFDGNSTAITSQTTMTSQSAPVTQAADPRCYSDDGRNSDSANTSMESTHPKPLRGRPVDLTQKIFDVGKECSGLVQKLSSDFPDDSGVDLSASDELYAKMMSNIENKTQEIQERARVISTGDDSPRLPLEQMDRSSYPVLSHSPRPRDGVQVTMSRQAETAQKSDHSFDDVLGGLLGLPATGKEHSRHSSGDERDASDDASDGKGEAPKDLVFDLLRHARTPCSSMTSLQARSNEHLDDDSPQFDPGEPISFNSDMPEMEEAKVRCRYPQCQKEVALDDARTTFKTCHNCFTYYCSRECRKAHWERHKRKCLYSRVNSMCKHVIKKIHDDVHILEEITKCARTGFLTKGRGCVVLAFSSPETACEFLDHGMAELENTPSFVNIAELESENVFGDHLDEIVSNCKAYHPDIKFVLEVAIVAGEEVPSWPAPRREGPAIKRCVRLRLANTQMRSTPAKKNEPETLILTAVPGSEYTENMNERKAREVCFINILRKLRQKGISLRHHYPDVYRKLCTYVADNENFTPMTIYPIDISSGKRFMCLIMPNSEPEVEWMYEPDLLEELGLSTQV